MIKQKSYSIIIAAGGTGGHIFPALAIALDLKAKGHRILIAGTGNELEKKIFSQYDIEVKYFKARILQRKGLKTFFIWSNYKTIFYTFFSNKKEREFIEGFGAALVVGMGGYPSLSLGNASVQAGALLIVHEQNAKAGVANRLLAFRNCTAIIEGLPGGFAKFITYINGNKVYLGNPIRPEIIKQRKPSREFPDNSKTARILIVGGSQGARSINHVAPKAMDLLSEKIKVEIRHDVGKVDYPLVKKMYKELNINANVSKFIDDIAEAYGWADLVIARAGALTISELSAVGLPSILIPYSHATDNHQFYNAKFLEDKKATEIILDKDLEPEKLADISKSFFSEKDKLKNASIAAFDETFIHATEKISKFCIDTIEKKTPDYSSTGPGIDYGGDW